MADEKTAYALVIGISTYSSTVLKLGNARNDAEAVADQLEQRPHRFVVTRLFDAEATREAVRGYFDELPAGLAEGSKFLLYFAGHGVALPGDEMTGPQGSLLLHEAELEDPGSWLDMNELRKDLLGKLKLSCRHLLVVLDCCHAGAFGMATRGIQFAQRRPLYRSQYERYLETEAWQALTSASAAETAADAVAGFTDRRGAAEHSPFAAALIDGLAGGADASSSRFVADGVITATELYSYIRLALTPVGGAAEQTPGIWKLEPTSKGEFVFENPRIKPRFEQDPDLEQTPNPWRGLAAYAQTAEDTELFFGRDRAIDELLALVTKPSSTGSLVAVVGASGTGKSSLVRAGLLPLLAEPADDRRDGVGDWAVVESARLTSDPNAQLAEAQDALAAAPAGHRRLLLIDQFEELFTQCPDSDARDVFLTDVRKLIDSDGGLTVLLTLRSDFEARAADSALKDLWPGSRYLVPPFTTDELRQVIEGPAARKAVGFDPPELVGKLVDEVNTMPGALPPLSFALAEMYRQLQRRWQAGERNRAISERDHETIGGVVGALNGRAAKLYDDASDAEQEATRRIFLRLVSQEGAGLTRRRVHQDELQFGGEQQPHIDAMKDRYVEAGLLVLDGEYVEPAHDALVREWQLLHEWLEENESQVVIRASWVAASDWKTDDKAPLWDRNSRLPLLKDSRAELNALERDFLVASLRRKKMRMIRMVAITAAVIAALLAATVITYKQRNTARTELAKATSRALASAANSQPSRNLDVPLLLSLEAYRASPTAEAKGSVISALDAFRRSGEGKILRAGQRLVNGVAFSSDGSRLAVGDDGGKVVVWDVAHDYGKLATLDSGEPSINGLAFSPDGSTLAAAVIREGKVVLWDADHDYTKIMALDSGKGSGRGVAFSPDGHTLAAAGGDGKVVLWDADHGYTKVRALDGGGSFLMGVAFSRDGNTLAASRGDGKVVLWDAARGYTNVRTLDSGKRLVFFAVAFNRNGTLAAVGSGRSVVLWDAGDHYRNIRTLDSHQSSVDGVAFSPDGATIAAGGREGTVVLWDVAHGYRKVQALDSVQVSVYGLAFRPRGGSTLAAAGTDGKVVLWAADHQHGSSNVLESGQEFVHGIAFSSNGSALAATGLDEVVLWDAAHGYRKLPPLPGGGSVGQVVAFSPQERSTLAAGGYRGMLLWDAAHGYSTLPSVGSDLGSVDALAFSPDGSRFAAGVGGTVALWNDVPDYAEVTYLDSDETPVNGLAFSPEGSTLAAAAGPYSPNPRSRAGGKVVLWRVGDAVTKLTTLESGQASVNGVAFSPDGNTLAAAGSNGQVVLWDATHEYNKLPVLNSGQREVNAIAFSPDGSTLAATVDDGVVLWDATHDFSKLTTLDSDHGVLAAVAFSPDGSTLAAAATTFLPSGTKGKVVLWDIFWDSSSNLEHKVCDLVHGNLTRTEWKTLAPGTPYRATCPD